VRAAVVFRRRAARVIRGDWIKPDARSSSMSASTGLRMAPEEALDRLRRLR